MFELTSDLLIHNNLEHGHYAEPFAGGCGLALALLFAGRVAEISINDIDASVWSFWNAVLNDTQDFVRLVETTEVTINEWHRQREVHRRLDLSDPLALGFSAFFLNRTNRSGVIKGGGVIGGLDQTGSYKIDCRFNVPELVRRIRRIARYKSRINLTRLDALAFLDACVELPERSLLFIDPPYYKKGPGLYTSFYRPPDHAKLAQRISTLKTPWVVTYDDTPEIRTLYSDQKVHSFGLRYSLNEKRTGSELLIAPSEVRMPPEAWRGQHDRIPREIAREAA